MKKVDVRITKAKIISYAVDLEDERPQVQGTIALYTEDDKKITTFTVNTRDYYENRFDLRLEMIPAIKDIAYQLEDVVVKKCNEALALLEYKNG